MWRKGQVLLILGALLLWAAPALAGGWAVITLDALPGEVRAGEELSIGFMVRQHGQTPTNAVSPILHARNAATGEEISVAAHQEGPTGHFVASVTFPGDGQWQWSITPAPFLQEGQLAPLTVLPAAPVTNEASAPVAQIATPVLLRWAALTLFSIAAILAALAFRRQSLASVPAAGD